MGSEIPRTRVGQKKSKPSHNIEGRTEKDLSKQRAAEKMSISKFKKRHRKDLSAAEIEAIVAASNEPFLMQKDIAIRFRITQTLASTLIREAKRKPEKLQNLRERERQLVAKKEAVETVVTAMLAINKPITGVN